MKTPVFVFLLLIAGGFLSAQDLNVNQNLTIGSNASYDEITITDGATLTITNGAVVCVNKNIVIEDGLLLLTGGEPVIRMGPDRTIKIRKKGRLFAEEATITSKGVGPGLAWRGVGVEGPGNSGSNQRGSIELQNATVENSRYGIGNYQLPYQGARMGGEVYCVNTTFKNNGRSIEGLEDGVGGQTGIDPLIYFEGCAFTIDQDFLNFNISFIGMATFWRNSELMINNCGFLIADEIADNPIFGHSRGLYLLQSYGEVAGCTFKNFHIGLEIDNIDMPNVEIPILLGIDVNRFAGNDYGCIVRSNNMRVENNQFKVGKSQIGLYLLESTGYRCSNNTFEGTSESSGTGILVRDSGPNNNRIAENRFSDLNIGILTSGSNRNVGGTSGLSISCNHFFDYGKAAIMISVNSPFIGEQGIARSQSGSLGTNNSPGNIFFNSNPDVRDIINLTGNQHIYYFLVSENCLFNTPNTPCNNVGITLVETAVPPNCEEGIAPPGRVEKSQAGSSHALRQALSDQISVCIVSSNPFSDELIFKVESPRGQSATLQLISLTGQVVRTQPVNLLMGENRVVLTELQNLPQGIHFYRLTTEDGEVRSGKAVRQ